MAWQMRVKEMPGTEDRQDPSDPTKTISIDITLEGRFRALVEYFDDDDDPRTILHTKAFDFGAGITLAEAVVRMKAEGRRVRDTKATLAEGQAGSKRLVGKTLPID